MMKQFDHMIERKFNPRLKFLAGCGQFSDFSNIILCVILWCYVNLVLHCFDVHVSAIRLFILPNMSVLSILVRM